MSTAHKLVFTDEDYKKAAIKWSRELLYLPLLSLESITKYLQPYGGLRYKAKLGSAESNAQFAPYKSGRKSASTTKVVNREIEAYPANVVEDFDPNDHMRELIGLTAATLGDGLKQAPSAKLVLACVMKSLGHHLRPALFDGVYDENGDTSMDVCDGFNTIADREIEAGNISEAKGNLIKVGTAFDSTNAVDIAKEIDRSCDPSLRSVQKYLYCSQEFYDAYCDAYLVSHPAVVYNKQFDQITVEGSRNLTTLAPIDVLSGSDKFYVSPKSNMLFGFDNMSDVSRIQVDRFAPFVLTLSAVMFLGTQFRSIDKRFLKVADMSVPAAHPAAGGAGDDKTQQGDNPEQQG